jgi:hypothetical protein
LLGVSRAGEQNMAAVARSMVLVITFPSVREAVTAAVFISSYKAEMCITSRSHYRAFMFYTARR